MNKRQRKKNKKKPGLFVGRPSTIGILFWPGLVERYKEQLDSGVIRHSKRREKLVFKVRRLEYLIWEHKGSRKVMYEVMNRTAHMNDKTKLKKIPEIAKQVETELWLEHRRQLNGSRNN